MSRQFEQAAFLPPHKLKPQNLISGKRKSSVLRETHTASAMTPTLAIAAVICATFIPMFVWGGACPPFGNTGPIGTTDRGRVAVNGWVYGTTFSAKVLNCFSAYIKTFHKTFYRYARTLISGKLRAF